MTETRTPKLHQVLKAHLERTDESLENETMSDEHRAYLQSLRDATGILLKENPEPKSPARFGNPVLPGCEPRLLKPIVTKWGNLQVYPIHELETHGLKFLDRFTCAMHPNAYSVHNLAERIVAFWEGRASIEHPMGQFTYIQQCGGVTRASDLFQADLEYALRKEPTRKTE
jgi:hypothetical protein